MINIKVEEILPSDEHKSCIWSTEYSFTKNSANDSRTSCSLEFESDLEISNKSKFS